jgi:hypothetical protein
MTTHPKRPRDLNQWAKRMVDVATGEASDALDEKPQKRPAKDAFQKRIRPAHRASEEKA